MKHVNALNDLNACSAAVEYAGEFPTLQKAWDACGRGDWMLWLIGKQITSKPWSEDRKPLLTCALDCAETVSHLWSNTTKEGVAVLRKWIAGEATTEEAQEARGRLRAAAAAAYADAAADAAAYAAADADAAAYAARKKNQKQTADIVRARYPKAPKL